MRRAVKAPILYVIAGSNGAGKTTFATEFFPRFVGRVNFINADLVARGLSPFHPERAAASAGRVVLRRIQELTAQRATFAIETTLSGRTYARMLRKMRAEGYRVHLYFLWVPDVGLALRRIRARVERGGHRVAAPIVRRRFRRTSWNLFHVYYDLVDYLAIIDNSGDMPRTIAETSDSGAKVYDASLLARVYKDGDFDDSGQS